MGRSLSTASRLPAVIALRTCVTSCCEGSLTPFSQRMSFFVSGFLPECRVPLYGKKRLLAWPSEN